MSAPQSLTATFAIIDLNDNLDAHGRPPVYGLVRTDHTGAQFVEDKVHAESSGADRVIEAWKERGAQLAI